MPLLDETLGGTLSWFLTLSKADVSNKLAFFLRICTSEWPEAIAALFNFFFFYGTSVCLSGTKCQFNKTKKPVAIICMGRVSRISTALRTFPSLFLEVWGCRTMRAPASISALRAHSCPSPLSKICLAVSLAASLPVNVRSRLTVTTQNQSMLLRQAGCMEA